MPIPQRFHPHEWHIVTLGQDPTRVPDVHAVSYDDGVLSLHDSSGHVKFMAPLNHVVYAKDLGPRGAPPNP